MKQLVLGFYRLSVFWYTTKLLSTMVVPTCTPISHAWDSQWLYILTKACVYQIVNSFCQFKWTISDCYYICTPLIIGKVNRSFFGVYSLYVIWVSVKYLGFRGVFVVVVSFHFYIEVLKKSFLINLKDFLYIIVQTLSLSMLHIYF